MASNKRPNWATLFASYRVDDVVASSSNLQEAATALNTTAPALRRAWSRYRDTTPGDVLGTEVQTGVRAEDLDGYVVRSRNRQVVTESRTIRVAPEDGETWLIFGDIHFGIEDRAALDLVFRVADRIGVDRYVSPGDTFDCYGISRHDKAADRIRSGNWALADERECARPWLKEMARSPKPSILLWGNHEQRLVRVADENPALDGCLSLRSVFAVPEAIQIGGPGDRIRAGSLVVEHGHDVLGTGSGGSYAAKKVYSAQPDQVTIFGHIHKIQEWRQTTYDEIGRPRTRMATSVGHLSLPEAHAHYAGYRPNWQQGFAVVQFFHNRNGDLRFEIANVEIHDHEFSFRGRVYS